MSCAQGRTALDSPPDHPHRSPHNWGLIYGGGGGNPGGARGGGKGNGTTLSASTFLWPLFFPGPPPSPGRARARLPAFAAPPGKWSGNLPHLVGSPALRAGRNAEYQGPVPPVEMRGRRNPARRLPHALLSFPSPLLPAMDLSATTASSSDLRAIRTGQEHERCASRSPMLGERAGESCEMKRGRQSDRRRLHASDAGRPRALPWRCPGGAAWWPAPPTIGPSSAPRVPDFNLQTLRGRTAGGLSLNFPGPRREWAGQISSRQPPARARGAKKTRFLLSHFSSISLPPNSPPRRPPQPLPGRRPASPPPPGRRGWRGAAGGLGQAHLAGRGGRGTVRPKKEGERGRESPSPAQLLRPLFEIPSLFFFFPSVSSPSSGTSSWRMARPGTSSCPWST